MALYKFDAVNRDGKVLEMVIEGDSPDDAVARLRGRGFLPRKAYGEVTAGSEARLSRRGFNATAFTNRLAPLLAAHIPLERALGIMAKRQEGEANRTVIVSLRKGLHEGKKLSELIRGHGGRFPRIYANLIETGEETGCMADMVLELRRHLNATKEQRDFLVTSAIYPATILVVTLLVVILMFTVFIPRFAEIFSDMGKELPLPTAMMLGMSRVFQLTWWLWPLAIAVVIWFFRSVKRGGKIKELWDGKVLKIPLVGHIVTGVEITMFIRTLSILIGNHVKLLGAITISSRVIGNSAIAASLAHLAGDVRSGKRLSVALEKSKYIPDDVILMLEVGEESGDVGAMLGDIADEMESKMKLDIKRLLALFEPAVIIILAAIVLLVVVSIFLAVAEMNAIN